MARPSRALAQRLAEALAARTVGARIDKLWRTGPRSLLLKIRGLDGAASDEDDDAPAPRLLIDLTPGHPRVVVTRRWPATPAAPDRHALIFRAHLEGARVAAVNADDRALTVDVVTRDGLKRLAVQLAGRYPNAAVFDPEGAELVRLVDGIPAVDPDSPPLPRGEDPWAGLDDGAFLVGYERVSDADARRREVTARVARLRRDLVASKRKAERAVRSLEGDLARVDAAAEDRHRGELLKTVLSRVPRGASEVAVADWNRDGATTVVPLDPAVDVHANMERYFKRYRKYASARDTVEERLLGALERVATCEAHLGAVDALARRAETDAPKAIADALEGILDAATPLLPRAPSPAAPDRRDADQAALPYRRFAAADGTAILVGRGGADNDRLTFQVARGNDVWLHARDAPGSHVVIRRAGAAPIAHETLVDAALLAAWHSRLRGDGAIDVMYTERKHVRRPRGASAGRVTTAAARTLTVRADPDRLERLYRTIGA